MNREEMLALAERVEAVPADICRDRELDAEIAAMFGTVEWKSARYTGDAFPAIRYVEPHPYAGMAEPVREYTSSQDAAMTLLPAKWKLRQMSFSAPCADDRKWHLNLHGGKEGEDTFVGRGPTPALALAAACLRARAQASPAEVKGSPDAD
jgi:hypothetical protein